ncbi:hypothetical protein IHE44_0005274 [Lamprotornis superbus]|uniref:Uncharacterized protein n=1 Tax=Lamprotornis superbus TaxID=245042 RepID=A0A835NZE2_9PASS|nr:hypothetical protein IHE44_0005274 [Lamprotornis superbus]
MLNLMKVSLMPTVKSHRTRIIFETHSQVTKKIQAVKNIIDDTYNEYFDREAGLLQVQFYLELQEEDKWSRLTANQSPPQQQKQLSAYYYLAREVFQSFPVNAVHRKGFDESSLVMMETTWKAEANADDLMRYEISLWALCGKLDPSPSSRLETVLAVTDGLLGDPSATRLLPDMTEEVQPPWSLQWKQAKKEAEPELHGKQADTLGLTSDEDMTMQWEEQHYKKCSTRTVVISNSFRKESEQQSQGSD